MQFKPLVNLTMRSTWTHAVGLCALWLVGNLFLSAVVGQDGDKKEEPTRPKIRRAARPEFTDRDRSNFFQDAFAGALRGERPTQMAAAQAAPSTGNGGPTTNGETAAASNSYAWSSIIKPDSIEQEVKRLNGLVNSTVTTPGKFESGDYRDARLHFSMLAMMFGIISEYDSDVKWKEEGPVARQLFGSMAANAKAGSREVYQQAKLRRDDLRDLINGGTISTPGEVDKETDWSTLVDRSPLMERLDRGYADRLKPFVANAGEFNSNSEQLMLEAAVVAAIAEVLTREGMPEALEDGYVEYAHNMRDEAKNIITAIESKNYDMAAEAVSRIDQACQNCHIDWQ